MPGVARAGTTQQSIFQDDRLLTSPDAAQQAAALDQVQFLGADTIHTVVNWRRLAPTKPSDPSNPATYSPGAWDAYDALVTGAKARGINVLMSPAGPVPNWASTCRKNVNSACKPSPSEYGRFVAALARRYSGSYVDEDQLQQPLPRVSGWTIWNEPNLQSWLYPQTQKMGRRLVPVAAAWYRRLVYAGIAALRANGHQRDQILVGETAPIGGNSKQTAPADFLLQLFCISANGRRFTGATAKQQGCSKAKRIQATGLSHHPYARGAGVPTGTKQKPGSLTIGVIDRFEPLLRAARHSTVAPRKLGVYFTEFGVTSSPPDHKFGVPLTRQSQYLNLVDYLAYRHPWVKSVSQFQLEDDTGLRTATFQTGLMFGDGKPKPSLGAYRTPIFVAQSGNKTIVWGQARPHYGARRPIQIQRRLKGGKFKVIASPRSNSQGYILRRFKAVKGATYRLRWIDANGAENFSRGVGAVPSSTPSTPGLPPPGPGTPPPPPPPTTDPGTPAPSPGPSGPPPPVQYTLSVTLASAGTLIGGSGSVTSSPSGIDCGSTCTASYDSGTTVTLTAHPTFPATTSWQGCDTVSGDQCTVAMSAARNVKATFTNP